MPFNGSGTWSNAGTSFSTPVTGTTISSTAAQTFFSDLASNGLSYAITKDGQTTLTANLPMGGFKLTGLAAGSANGDSLRYEQGVQSILTTTGDMLIASAANTAARYPAVATLTAHATTMDPWVSRVGVLSGSAVTFTDIADADFVGQVVWLRMNAAHVWTNGAVFAVQGGANYTAASGDWLRLEATAVDAFDVTIFKVSGAPVSMSPITASLSGDVTMNNTANYFTGPSIAQGTSGTWLVMGSVTARSTAGAANFMAKLWDGTTVIDSGRMASLGVNNDIVFALSGYITAPAGNLRISVRDESDTSGLIKFNATGESKDSTITAIRIA